MVAMNAQRVTFGSRVGKNLINKIQRGIKMENKSSGYIYLIAFALSIPAANYMIGNV